LRYGTLIVPPFVRALTEPSVRQVLERTFEKPFEAILDRNVELRAHCLRMGAEALELGRDVFDA